MNFKKIKLIYSDSYYINIIYREFRLRSKLDRSLSFYYIKANEIYFLFFINSSIINVTNNNR